MLFNKRLSPRPELTLGLWLAGACLIGWFIATQSIAVVIISLVCAALVLLAVITPLAALMALLILSPLRTLIATEAPLKLPLDIGQMAFIGLLGIWVIYRIAHQRPLLHFRWTSMSSAIALFIAVTGLTGFTATSLSSWLSEWLKWVIILVMITLTLDIGQKGRWQWLVFGLVLSGVANALIGIYEFLGGSGALHLLINDRFFRAFGTFGQPNPFGGFMGLLTPLALMAFAGYSLRGWQIWRVTHHLPRAELLVALFYATASLLLLIGIGISWSRGAWLGVAVALAVVALALPRRILYGLAAVGLVVGVLAFLWFTDLLPPSVIQRIQSSTEEYFVFTDVRGIDISPENYAVTERLAHWQAALNMVRAHPWLGVGFGNYEIVYPHYRLLNWYEPLGHAHNYYLNILAEAGFIGFLGYGKAWLIILLVNWRVRRHPDGLARCIVIGLLGTWIYLAVHHLFDNLYVNNLFIHLGLMLGLLSLLYNETQDNVKLGVS